MSSCLLPVTDTEVVTGAASRAATLLQHPNARVFHDYSEITELKIPSNTFFELAASDPERLLPLRRAVLVKDTLVAGLVRFVLGTDMPGSLRTFYRRDKALQ